MEPLSALSVAAAVVQFIDFGSTLISETRAVYKSATGQTQTVVELSTVAADLAILSKNIADQLMNLGTDPPAEGSSKSVLLRLCKECQSLCSEISAAVEKLRVVGLDNSGTRNGRLGFYGAEDAVKSLIVVLKERLGMEKKKINYWRDMLSPRGIQGRMTTAITALLWEQSEKGSDQLDTLIRQQSDILSALAVIEANTSLRTGPGSRDRSGRSAPDETLDVDEIDDDDNDENEDTKAGCQKAVLQSLYFDGITWRETSIQQTYEHTFNWAFTQPKPQVGQEHSWSCLTDWLESPTSDIYWITGKPGSGKSTLMRFLVSNPVTSQHLQRWASPHRLILLSFYFWNAGQLDMQKSQEGLIRSLLYQCISRSPELLPQLCPRHWALFKVFGVKALRKAPRWTLQELAASFALLGDPSDHSSENLKFALFIDGLDEFDGDHETLLDLIHRLTGNPRIKICVSSRPWNIFLDTFATNPSLRMEYLTRNDIETVVRGRLGKTRGFKELQDAFPREAESLMTGIVEKARGVFLWAIVVLSELCEGLQEGDKLAELNETLENLPHDIENLYDSIWVRIKPRYIAHSSQLFQLHHWSTAYQRQADRFYDDTHLLPEADAIMLWLADQDDALSQDINVLRDEKKAKVCQMMQRRLNSRTRGLLEISSAGHVDFLHKSVRDWKRAKWDDICSKSAPNFDPNLAFLKALSVDTIYAKHFWPQRIEACVSQFSVRANMCLFHASRIKDLEPNIPAIVQTLKKMDINLAYISSKYCRMRDVPFWWFWFRKKTELSKMAKLSGSPSTFIELAAQVPILPYVRHKIQQCPDIDIAPFLKVLHCAIFGFHGGFDRPLARDLGNLKPRIELVRFLRDNGPLKARDKRYKAICKAVEGWEPVSGLRTPEEVEYWNAVESLLSETNWAGPRSQDVARSGAGGRKLLDSVKGIFRSS